jgi:hypothetical protein
MILPLGFCIFYTDLVDVLYTGTALTIGPSKFGKVFPLEPWPFGEIRSSPSATASLDVQHIASDTLWDGL